MPKYKAKNKNSKLIVRVKLLRGEQLAARDLSMVSQREFRGLLKPAVVKSNLLEYTGPQGSSLSDYLKQPLTGYEFHFILAQIIRLERKLSTSELPIKHLIVYLRYIYINPYTKELQFIYLPLSTGFPCVAVRKLMETIICQWRPAPEEDMQYPARFLSLLRSQPGYMPDQILAYIKQYDARVAEQLRKTQTSMSGFITNKQADYYSHYGTQGGPQTDNLPGYDPSTDILPGLNTNRGSRPAIEETGLLTEEFPDDTALLETPNGGTMTGGNPAFPPQTHPVPCGEEETGLLDTAQFPQWNEETGLLNTDQPPQWQEETGLLNTEQFPQWQEETGLLGDGGGYGDTELFEDSSDPSHREEETGLLTNVSTPPSISSTDDRYPYLIRRSMNERISINKPVFRIGKERSYVDCFISNNGAISRSHADIIKRGNRYFICDRNSTNKTYRNGYMLTPEDEVEIFDGDILQLANEEFEFHTH